MNARQGKNTKGPATRQEHYPYGEPEYSWNANEFVFTSYSRDTATSLDYAMARYYDSSAGRFCSADPVAGNPNDPLSWNRYSYSRNDPIDLTDASGQSLLTALIGFAWGLFFQNHGMGLPGQAPPFGMPGGPSNGTVWNEQPPIYGNAPSWAIIENWSPNAHDEIIWNALKPCGVSNADIYRIQQGSRDVDNNHQSPHDSYMHAMRDGTTNQSPEDAMQETDTFVAMTAHEAKAELGGGDRNSALYTFGQAMHPVMDATSPAHRDPSGTPYAWCGPSGCPDYMGDNVGEHTGSIGPFDIPPGEEGVWDLRRNPSAEQKAISGIRDWFDWLTGQELNCDGGGAR